MHVHAGTLGGGGGHLRGSLDAEKDEGLGAVYDHQVVLRLMRYLIPHRTLVMLAMACTVIYAASHSAGPWLIGLAIDQFITTGDLPGLTVLAGIFVLNGLLSWATQYGQTIALAWVGQDVLHQLRTGMFDHLQRLSLGFFDANEVGRLMSRVQNDVLALQELLTNGFFNVVQDIISLVIVVYFFFSMNANLAAVTLVVVPVLVVIMAFWQRLARKAFMNVRHAISVVNAGLQENISGVRVIQSLTREETNSREFDRVNANHFLANLRAGRLSAAIHPMVEMLVAVATALVVVVGGVQVLEGDMALGALVAFTLYIQRFFDPIRELTMQYAQFQRAMVGGERIFEVLDARATVTDREGAVDLPSGSEEVRKSGSQADGQLSLPCVPTYAPPGGRQGAAVRFEHVSFSYVPGIPVLRDFDLDVSPGQTVALVGATGAGKSTVLSLLARFYDVTPLSNSPPQGGRGLGSDSPPQGGRGLGGRVLIDGHDVRDVTQASLRRQLGIVLQEPFLFSGTVRENIRYGRLEAADSAIEDAAKALGAHDFIMRLEDGYGTVLQERGGNLSQGQRQLLSFARALLADPRVLVLDEATANVDTQAELAIQRALRRLLQGRTSFVIAHRLSTIRDAHTIVVMERGRIVEQGTHAELLARSGVYAGLYTMTFATVSGRNEVRGTRHEGTGGTHTSYPIPRTSPS